MRRGIQTRTYLFILLMIGLIALPSGGFSARAQNEQVYLALGDSIPAGLLASLPSERGYPAILRDLMETQRVASDSPGGVDLINLAEPGETVQSFIEDGQLAAAISEIEAVPPGALQTVTVTIGGNNILALWESTAAEREAERERFQRDFGIAIGELSDALEDHQADVVVTTYYDLTEGDPSIESSNSWWLRQFNSVIVETATEAGFEIVDLEVQFRGRVDALTWFPADIHPNNAGHRLIARSIWQHLEYDQEPPEVEILRPLAGETRSQVPTIHARVEDAVGIDSVVLQVDDGAATDLLYVPALDLWIGLWDGRGFTGSEAELTVIATDVSGNESTDSVTISLPAR